MSSTHEALEEWAEVVGEVSEKWSELMEQNHWKDLPPDVERAILEASHTFAVAGEVVNRQLEASTISTYDE